MSIRRFFTISCIIVMSGKDVHVLITFIVLFTIKADVHVPLIKSGEPLQDLSWQSSYSCWSTFLQVKHPIITNTLFGCHTVAIESEESVQLQIHSWLTWCSPTSPPLLSLSRGSLYHEGAGRWRRHSVGPYEDVVRHRRGYNRLVQDRPESWNCPSAWKPSDLL